MELENKSFKEVLNDAKKKGYTSDYESKLDIGGYDSAHKLTILASICFGSQINFSINEIKGISDINIIDLITVNKLLISYFEGLMILKPKSNNSFLS